MIDGVKLLCGINPKDWADNKNLSFFSRINENTGEIPNNNKFAEKKGLRFSITEKEKNVYYNVRGSLHKYYFEGKTNACDYHLSDFLNTIEDLHQNFKINPETTVLQNIEFGVNIELPFDISHVYECCKSYKMQIFGINKIAGKNNGLRIELQQYKIKIYDKGLQETGKTSRLMRFEIAVNKMEKVKHLGIKNLKNLQSLDVWGGLSEILLKAWDEIIFIDKKSVNYKLLSAIQQKKFLRFLDSFYWENLNRNIYHKSKNHLNKLFSEFGKGDNKKQIIYNLIQEKLQKLQTANPVLFGDKLTAFIPGDSPGEKPENSQPIKTEKWRQINSLDKGLETVTISHTFFKENDDKKDPTNQIHGIEKKKPKNCKCCRKKISGKKSTSLFCSVKCKNKHHQSKKSKTNQVLREKEKIYLQKLLPKIEKGKLWVSITYIAENGLFTDRLYQSEILPPKELIIKIRAVSVASNSEFKNALQLTTVRAKNLIRAIVKHNQKLEKRKSGDKLTEGATG